MAINYVKVKRNITVGTNAGEKFLARIYRSQDVELEQIASDIADSTTVSEADVVATLKALEKHIVKYVQNGSAVKLGVLGSFIPSITAKAQESADLVDNTTIKRISCRFYPSVKFKYELSKASLSEKDLTVKGLVE